MSKEVLVILCSNCSGNGDCDFTQYDIDGTETSFAVAGCVCYPGYDEGKSQVIFYNSVLFFLV